MHSFVPAFHEYESLCQHRFKELDRQQTGQMIPWLFWICILVEMSGREQVGVYISFVIRYTWGRWKNAVRKWWGQDWLEHLGRQRSGPWGWGMSVCETYKSGWRFPGSEVCKSEGTEVGNCLTILEEENWSMSLDDNKISEADRGPMIRGNSCQSCGWAATPLREILEEPEGRKRPSLLSA